MNFSEVFQTLNQASAFDLYRLRAAIDRALGDVVGFVDRDQQQRTGQIIRLNDKTVTLQCAQGQWRVAYSFLHRVVDVDSAVHEVAELGATQ